MIVCVNLSWRNYSSLIEGEGHGILFYYENVVQESTFVIRWHSQIFDRMWNCNNRQDVNSVNIDYLRAFVLVITAVVTKWLADQTAYSVNDASSSPTWMQVFSAEPGHCTAAFNDAITGATELIISIANSIKIVNIHEAWLPLLKEGKSLGILFVLDNSAK